MAKARIYKFSPYEQKQGKRGVVLFVVLATILIIIFLANALMLIMLSQTRFTHHKVSRIQAYYAAMAGINYAMERIRSGDANWIPSPDTLPNTRTRILCRGCSAPDVDEPNLPSTVQQVTITIGAANSGLNGTRQINAQASFTYSP